MPEVEDPADVGVRDLTRQLNLVPEAADRNGVRRDLWANCFQGNADLQLEILCLVHLPHSTLADDANNSKAPRNDVVRRKSGPSGVAGRHVYGQGSLFKRTASLLVSGQEGLYFPAERILTGTCFGEEGTAPFPL